MAAKPPEDVFPNGRGGRSAPADWRLPLPAAPREADAVEEYGPDQPAINGFSTQRAGQVKRQKIRRKTRSFAYRCGRGGWREGRRQDWLRAGRCHHPFPGRAGGSSAAPLKNFSITFCFRSCPSATKGVCWKKEEEMIIIINRLECNPRET